MHDSINCNKCGNESYIEGEYPEFFAWCTTCDDYAEGFDCLAHAADHMGNLIDHTYDRMRDGD